MTKRRMFMAIDQWGQTYHGLERPRRDLLAKLGRTKSARMFVDKATGETVQVGWIIAGHWLTVYEVKPLELKG